MIRKYILFLITIVLTGCLNDNGPEASKPNSKLTYIFVGKTRHSIDTVYRKIVNEEYEDSIYRVSYLEFYKNDSIFRNFELPISKSVKIRSLLKDTINSRITLLENKTISYHNKDYIVYKYLYDDENTIDEELFYFFVSEYGIIIGKSVCWGNYDRLIGNGIEEDTDDIFFIGEMIIFDFEFFHNFANNLPPPPPI